MIIPTELGGLGKGIVEHQEAVLAFAKYCPTAGLCYMMHNVAVMTILVNGSEELKSRIFKDVVENNKFFKHWHIVNLEQEHIFIFQI